MLRGYATPRARSGRGGTSDGSGRSEGGTSFTGDAHSQPQPIAPSDAGPSSSGGSFHQPVPESIGVAVDQSVTVPVSQLDTESAGVPERRRRLCIAATLKPCPQGTRKAPGSPWAPSLWIELVLR